MCLVLGYNWNYPRSEVTKTAPCPVWSPQVTLTQVYTPHRMHSHFYGQERAGQSANLSSTLIPILTKKKCKNICKYVDSSSVLHVNTFINGDDEVTVSVELEEQCSFSAVAVPTDTLDII